jgi:hypothetical protein
MAKSLAKMFLEAAKPDAEGKTSLWRFTDLEALYEGYKFHTPNGGGWCRSDGELKPYIVDRVKENGRNVGIQLLGFRDTTIEKRIRTDIFKSIKKQRCRVVDVGGENIECDHKDGRYSSDTYGDVENQTEDDFQPLLRNVNLSKRTHCKVCEETNERYDAKKLGYSAGWIEGDKNYLGTCFGCFWYDPRKFNQVISKDFIKEGG